MHVYVICVLRASFLSSFRRTKRNPDVARGKPYYLLDPLLTIISFFLFLFFFIYVLLKWTTHLDVRTVSNLLQSLTTFFRAFFLRFSTMFSSVTGPALNLRMFPHKFIFAECPYLHFSMDFRRYFACLPIS